MATRTPVVRDAIVEHYSRNAGQYLTADEIADKLKLARDSTAATLHSLAARAVLVRRLRDGSKAYEYAQGKRIAFGLKYAGRKFPFSKKVNGADDSPAPKKQGVWKAPAPSGGVGIVIKVDNTAHAITLAQAEALYQELRTLFDR